MQNEIYFGYDLLPDGQLEHYGIPRRSGRYPWGSGEDPYHHGASSPSGRELKKARKARAKEARERSRNRGILSDKELDQAIERLSKEKRLRELTNSEYNRGRSKVNDIMDRVVLGTGVSLAALTLSSAGKIYLRRKLGETTTDGNGNETPVPWTEIAQYLKPKKK